MRAFVPGSVCKPSAQGHLGFVKGKETGGEERGTAERQGMEVSCSIQQAVMTVRTLDSFLLFSLKVILQKTQNALDVPIGT